MLPLGYNACTFCCNIIFGMSNSLTGKLFIVSGPSGVGKGTVIRALKQEFPQFVFPISHTTRTMRPGEKDGDVYHFISDRQFQEGIDKGEFLEYAQVHKKDYYGTLKKPVMDALEAGKIVVREVDVQGFHSITRVVPKNNLVTIFIKAESLEKLIERIAKRGKLPAEELERRMESARVELAQAAQFDYQVWSLEDKIPECVDAVRKIILEEVQKAGLKI
jgi:guanylate kinase